jgi:hypothetical protein
MMVLSGQRAGGYRLGPAQNRVARWTSLDPDQRAVFNVWAKSVAAFYLLLIVALLAMLPSVQPSVGPKVVSASATLERNLPAPSAPGSGRFGK